MPDQFITFGSWTIRTYTAAVALGIVASVGFGVYRARKTMLVGRTLDVYLGGLIGGVALARTIHALLNWDYFAYNRGEITAISAGGLDWHGAVIGGLMGMALVARWRKVKVMALIDALTPALPLIALGAWFGCWSMGCAYGAEVARLTDFPAVMVWEGPDVFGIYAPRFHTQVVGMAFSGGLLVLAGLLMLSARFKQIRFWIILGLLGAGMWGIGWLRGDYSLYAGGLRLDQWLDGAMMVVAITAIVGHAVSCRKHDVLQHSTL